MLLTRLGCPECESELAGAFEPCEFCGLAPDDREVLRLFLASRGNVKEVERKLGVSYPAARARVDDLLTKLGLLPEEERYEPPPSSDRLATLERLARGEINVDEAEQHLQ